MLIQPAYLYDFLSLSDLTGVSSTLMDSSSFILRAIFPDGDRSKADLLTAARFRCPPLFTMLSAPLRRLFCDMSDAEECLVQNERVAGQFVEGGGVDDEM